MIVIHGDIGMQELDLLGIHHQTHQVVRVPSRAGNLGE